jgi:hypothetical protein
MKLENLSTKEIHHRRLGYFAAARDRYVCNFAETHGYGKGAKARQKNWANGEGLVFRKPDDLGPEAALPAVYRPEP